MKYTRTDLKQVTTYPLAERRNKMVMSRDSAGEVSAGMSVSELLSVMPPQLGALALNQVVEAIVSARQKDKPVVFALGGHVFKCGLQPVLKSLVNAGMITAFAINGAGSIHDYELSLIAETSEDVGAVLHCGKFGMAEETGRDINRALREGIAAGLGYGEAVGRFILQNNNPYSDYSLLALCVARSIPVTVHVAIGNDIIHQHPDADGAVIGEASFRDFRLFTSIVSQLGNGGVFVNIGSAVIIPEVFLKALSIAQNLGHHVDNFTTANFDMVQHYRPQQNVVGRPTAGTSRGYSLTGHHEIMIPLLAAGILDRLGGGT